MPKRLVAGFVVAGLLFAACAGRGPKPRHPGARSVMHGSSSRFRSASTRTPWTRHVGRYPYDPGKARQLLRQAGAEGITVTLGSPRGRYMGDSEITEAVARDLRAAGLQVSVPEPVDWPACVDATTQPPGRQPYDLHLQGAAPSYLDVSGQLLLFQSAYWPPAGRVDCYHDSTAVDQLVARANEGRDAQERQQANCEAQKAIWDHSPWIFLHYQKLPVVTTTRVVGVTMLPNEQFDTVYARPA